MTLTNVFIYGILKEKTIIEGFRLIEVEKLDPFSRYDEKEKIKIPLKYWGSGYENELLLNSKEGVKCFLRGRLETDKSIGLYVLVEKLEIL